MQTGSNYATSKAQPEWLVNASAPPGLLPTPLMCPFTPFLPPLASRDPPGAGASLPGPSHGGRVFKHVPPWRAPSTWPAPERPAAPRCPLGWDSPRVLRVLMDTGHGPAPT